MPGLMSPHTAPDGRRMMVDSDLLDIDRRIKEGDGTVGWVGDDGLWLEFDQARNVFIVCRYDSDTGRTDDVMSYPPPLNAGLLIKLRDADTRRPGNDPVARMFAEDDAREAAAEAQFEEFIAEETAPRLAHALRKGGLDEAAPKPVFFPKDT